VASAPPRDAVVVVTHQIIDQDRAATLKKVSAELDHFVKNRTVVAFTDADKMRYEALCQREQELICQTEATNNTGA
jgi:hypothetical protein